MMMTTLTAIFGLLPAALSTRIGAQSQQPLAIVVIGGMLIVVVCLTAIQSIGTNAKTSFQKVSTSLQGAS
jgi:Cu/Ag efflux pump CusA